MYSVGSVGAVDPADIEKIVCWGSVIQLGPGILGSEPVAADVAEVSAQTITFPTITAMVRYAVPPDPAIEGAELGDLMLALRYRPGPGNVVATLIEVPFWEGFSDPGTVPELPLLRFDSEEFAKPNAFQTKVVGGPEVSNPNHVITFGTNVYYISLALSVLDRGFIVPNPPAVSSLELVPFQFLP